MKTQKEKLQELFHQYTEAHGGVPAPTSEVAKWAVDHGLIERPRVDPMDILADRMANALREEYGTDPETGQRYRKNHAARVTRHGVQFTMWAELDSAPREFMQRALQQRRQQIVGDCIQLKADVDVFNRRNPHEEPIQMILDFADDVAEHEAAIAPRDTAA